MKDITGRLKVAHVNIRSLFPKIVDIDYVKKQKKLTEEELLYYLHNDDESDIPDMSVEEDCGWDDDDHQNIPDENIFERLTSQVEEGENEDYSEHEEPDNFQEKPDELKLANTDSDHQAIDDPHVDCTLGPLESERELSDTDSDNQANADHTLDPVTSEQGLLITNLLPEKSEQVKTDFVLPLFNNINKEMQSQSPKIHLVYSKICSTLRTLFDCFLKRECILDKSIENIDFINPINYLDLEQIYYGARVQNIFHNHTDLTPEQKHLFQLTCLNFYIESCNQIVKRMPLESNKLKEMSIIDPAKVKSGEISSIAHMCGLFSLD
ncbi:unnamed protein product [Diabrotica balteata]|uniref:Uncharacterized protein n=1 Tax=Diabrotica balteata TaxID=107213 RepID=A0A9N9XI20_DIABA|nr:unnamed protein product [Diabrotica balteata]